MDEPSWVILLLVVFAFASPVGASAVDRSPNTDAMVERNGLAADSQLTIRRTDLPDEIAPGERYTIAAQVENTGSTTATRTVEYVFEGQTVFSKDVSLSPGERDTVVFEVTLDMIETSVGSVSAGTHTHGFVTEGGAKHTEQVTVRTGSTAAIEVERVGLPDTIREGESFTVSVTLANTGDRELTRTISYSFGGETVAVIDDKTIAAGESQTFRLPQLTLDIIRQATDRGSIATGTYTHAIGVENGPRQSAEVRVVTDSTGSDSGTAAGDETVTPNAVTESASADARRQRGFLTNGDARFPILSNVLNLTVLGFLLSVFGIFHQLLGGR